MWRYCCRIYFIKKYIYILAVELAGPGNQHCATCIGTLSFPTDRERAERNGASAGVVPGREQEHRKEQQQSVRRRRHCRRRGACEKRCWVWAPEDWRGRRATCDHWRPTRRRGPMVAPASVASCSSDQQAAAAAARRGNINNNTAVFSYYARCSGASRRSCSGMPLMPVPI